MLQACGWSVWLGHRLIRCFGTGADCIIPGMDSAIDFLPRSEEHFRRKVLLAFEKLLYWSGAGHAYLKLRRLQGTVILNYHSVATAANAVWIDPRNRLSPGLFEQQMRFLAAHRRVISMNALVDALMERNSLAAGSVVLTFDDGYRDNLEIAAPILQRYGLPALLYVPTRLVTRGESPWADALYTMFRTRTNHTLYFPHSERVAADLRNPRLCRAAYWWISRELVSAGLGKREAMLALIEEQLAPRERPPRLTLNWDELRALRDRFPLFALGVHSANHVDFTSQEKHIVLQELRECSADFEHELGTPAEHFAYPYNRRNAEIDRLVAAAGLRTAVASGPDYLISASHNPYNLPRISAPRSISLYRFWTSGAYPDLPRSLFGRA